jgi:hypothetical protein
LTRSDQWDSASNGPDWTDVEMLMRAMGSLHSAHVALVVSPLGNGLNGGVMVVGSALFELLPGSALPPAVQVEKAWPCNTHKTLATHAFALLHELDFAISRVYKNEELWK